MAGTLPLAKIVGKTLFTNATWTWRPLCANILLMAKSVRRILGERARPVSVRRVVSDGVHVRNQKRKQKYEPVCIDDWLDQAGRTRSDLADFAGYSISTISLLANGRRQYTQENLERIAQFFNVHPSELLHPPLDQPLTILIARMSPPQRKKARKILEAFEIL